MKLLHLVLTVIAVSLSLSAIARAEPACIDDKARRVLACGDAPKASGVPAPPKSPVFRSASVAARGAPSKTPALTARETRDDRSLRIAARQRDLLVVEVQKIESLFGSTKRTAPDRLGIARRLADGYVELESAAFRDKIEAEVRRDGWVKQKNTAKAGGEQTTVNEMDRVEKAARKRAIELYTLLANDYPTHPKIDEVLYYLAYEYEQASDFRNARAAYYDLIKKAPTSRYIPNAYLAFGELFFNEAQGDPSKWDLAVQAYAEVVKYPAPQNRVQGYAYYKLAYVHWNKGDLDKALDAFKKTIEFGVANPTLPGATKLADNARRDTIPVYALRGDPKLAYGFVKGISGDPVGSSDNTYRMLDELGNAYIDTGHYPEAIVVYKDLMVRDRGRACGYQARITDATMAMKSADKDGIKTELERLLGLASGAKPEGDRDARTCRGRTAALVAETAMAWHLEAVGSNGQRGTFDKRTMSLAATLYQRTIDTFSAKELSSFEYPRLIKEDWPTASKIRYAMADLLYEEKDWAKCGPAFDAVLAEDPSGADAATAAFAAALCYQAAYEESHKAKPVRERPGQLADRGSAALKPKDMSAEQTAMVRAFERYACAIKPAPNDKAGQEQLVEIQYARARTYFEAQHWEEAAVLFRQIALEHSDREVGTYAARLYLESANVLQRHFGKASCEDDMSADMPRLLELYCAGDRASKNGDGCNALRVVQVDLMRLRAQRLVDRADRLGPKAGREASESYEHGGTAYFELFRMYCQDPVAAGNTPQAEHCDEIAYNAAKAFQAARLLAKAITVRGALLAFDERLHLNSPLAKKSAYEIGANYQAIAVYDQAADWFERYARSDSRASEADRALSDAVVLRLGLGQDDQAVKDARDFVRSYGVSRPALAGTVAFAIGAHYIEKAEWEKARQALSNAMSTIDRAPLDVQLQAHAKLAQALSHLGDAHLPQVRTEFAKVRRLWSDPAAGEQKIRDTHASEDEAQRARRVGRAVEAVGEALFFAAEERKAAEVDSLRFPEYKGAGDKASVKAHVDTKVKDWYLKKKAAIERVEAEYAKILDLKPAAPPRLVIASGSRAGLMWGDFVDDFRRSPIPKSWRGTQAAQVYTTSVDLASEPYKVTRAKPALKHCLDLSTKYQYFDDYSRRCEEWLAKNYKGEYHVIDELRAAPTLPNSAEKAPPLLSNSAFFHDETVAAAPEEKAKPSSAKR